MTPSEFVQTALLELDLYEDFEVVTDFDLPGRIAPCLAVKGQAVPHVMFAIGYSLGYDRGCGMTMLPNGMDLPWGNFRTVRINDVMHIFWPDIHG